MGLFACFSAGLDPAATSSSPPSSPVQKVVLVEQSTQTDDGFLREMLGMTMSSYDVNDSAKRSPDSITSQPRPLSGVSKEPSHMQVDQSIPSLLTDEASQMQQTLPDDQILTVDSNRASGIDQAVRSEARRVFLEFARFGTRSETKGMDIFRFMKLCRECHLLARQQDANSIDLIFYKCKGQNTNKMNFAQFKAALPHIAGNLEWPLEDVYARIIESEGPLVNNITLPRYVRQHDDVDHSGSPTTAKSYVGSMSGFGGSPTASGVSKATTPMARTARTPSARTPRTPGWR